MTRIILMLFAVLLFIVGYVSYLTIRFFDAVAGLLYSLGLSLQEAILQPNRSRE